MQPFGIASANTIMATTSAIKTNLQSVVSQKFIRHTNTNTPGCLLQRITFSFTPEEPMLVEMAKACVY